MPEDDNYLGDIVISVDTAERQAKRRKSTLHRELRILALHGYLHLLGYDHETDEGDMRRIEYRLRRRFLVTRPSKKSPAVRSGKGTKKK
jgi:probable rRNA maturation factor